MEDAKPKNGSQGNILVEYIRGRPTPQEEEDRATYKLHYGSKTEGPKPFFHSREMKVSLVEKEAEAHMRELNAGLAGGMDRFDPADLVPQGKPVLIGSVAITGSKNMKQEIGPGQKEGYANKRQVAEQVGRMYVGKPVSQRRGPLDLSTGNRSGEVAHLFLRGHFDEMVRSRVPLATMVSLIDEPGKGKHGVSFQIDENLIEVRNMNKRKGKKGRPYLLVKGGGIETLYQRSERFKREQHAGKQTATAKKKAPDKIKSSSSKKRQKRKAEKESIDNKKKEETGRAL